MVEFFDVWGGVDAMFGNRGIVYPNEAKATNTPKKILDLAYNVNRKGAIPSICFPLSSLLVPLLPNFPILDRRALVWVCLANSSSCMRGTVFGSVRSALRR